MRVWTGGGADPSRQSHGETWAQRRRDVDPEDFRSGCSVARSSSTANGRRRARLQRVVRSYAQPVSGDGAWLGSREMRVDREEREIVERVSGDDLYVSVLETVIFIIK
ncbi:hypothetical protein M6B38_389455 [Iris pallida]|uniref:Uncharacterized protein n=1 Tax=Iris pallida TaxID=29817 RepID=A0AAX6G1Q6_IRIPA|nr:hypothetical protein M6B38_389455 [Iris pallida]